MIDEIAVPPAWSPAPALVERLREEYHAARPWPHAVVTGLLPEQLLTEVVGELRTLDRSAMRGSRTRRHSKRETSDRDLLGPASRMLQDLLDSPRFVDTVAAVTGIDGLLSDPTHYAAGVHETPRGGKTMIHLDFTHHPVTRLHHRVNVLVYLNPGWQDGWGGQLELWPVDMAALGRRIQPAMNTMVIWETHGGTPHGLPDPVAGPPGTSRFAMASYYYTTEARAEPVPRSTIGTFVARPSDSRWTGLPLPRDLVRAWMPTRIQHRLWPVVERLRAGRRPQ